MSKIPGQYKHNEIESKWQEYWLKKDIYVWDESQAREANYVIDTPPPTVSGSLHMGHIYSYTQADIIARYQRMKGMNVFYPMGFDDNGLPTERLVEKVKKIRPNQMERSEFQKICYGVVEEAEKEFYNLFNSVGLSVDWKQKYQTISPHSRKISQMSFLDLFHKNHCYRAMEPNLWDPKDGTALAQADIEDKEIEGHMVYINFSVNGAEKLTIATTRPEMLPACVAVLYHPEDKRYKHLQGQKAKTCLFDVEVPLIADDTVAMDKGTGAVMCCTFGDTTDIEWWKKHHLPLKMILDKYAKVRFSEALGLNDSDLTKKIIDEVEGLKVEAARAKMIDFLKENDCVVKIESVMKNVKCAERSGSPIEIQVVPQWLIKLLDKKEEIKQKASQISWFPDYMKIRLENWVDGLNWDWCISRQRFFGVPFPVWYSKRKGEEGKIIVADVEELPVDPAHDLPKGYTRDEVEAELDVMDTWATSAISPQLSSQAISRDYAIDYARHEKLYPADLRPQAHEIIRTWTFYTIAKSLLHENSIPWKNIVISGWCLAEDKTKMSKSKGNAIMPVDLIHNKGADIVRYWTSTSKLGADIAYSEKLLDVGKKLVNKLWNATKFVASHIENLDDSVRKESNIICDMDKWIILRLNETIDLATAAFEKNEYSDARRAVERFFWNDFCDNYLEIVKVRVYSDKPEEASGKLSAQVALSFVIESILKLFAPIMPHITEDLYATLFHMKHREEGSIHCKGNWPSQVVVNKNDAIYISGLKMLEAIELVRRAKTDKQLSMRSEIEKLSIVLADNKNTITSDMIVDLKNVSNAKTISLNETINENDLENIYISENNDVKIHVKFVL